MLNIEKEEISKVAFLWFMGFFWGFGDAIRLVAINTMLVKRLGIEYLPFMYICIGAFSGIGSLLYLKFADFVRRDVLFLLFSAGTAITLILARIFMPEDILGIESTGKLIFFLGIIFIIHGVGYFTLNTQLWTIINDVIRPVQGKRIYPIINLAVPVGGIVSGIFGSLLISITGVANLILLWGGCSLFLFFLILFFRKRYGVELRGKERKKSLQPEQNIGEEERNAIRYLIKTPFMYVLIIVAVAFWIVGSMADFQYTKIMNASFVTEKSLGLYFSCYTLIYSISAILIQLFFAGSFVKRIGVERGLSVLPAVSILGGAGILVSFSFIFGFLLRYMWDVVGMSIQANAFQLTQNAIPGRLRGRIRGIIDGIINPGGSIIGGLLILFLNRYINHVESNAELITILLILFAVFWIVSAIIGHKLYISALISNLKSDDKETAFDAIESLGEPFCRKSLNTLIELVKSENVDFRKRALLSLPLTYNPCVHEVIRKYINDDNEIIRDAAISAEKLFSKNYRVKQQKFNL